MIFQYSGRPDIQTSVMIHYSRRPRFSKIQTSVIFKILDVCDFQYSRRLDSDVYGRRLAEKLYEEVEVSSVIFEANIPTTIDIMISKMHVNINKTKVILFLFLLTVVVPNYWANRNVEKRMLKINIL